MGGRGSESTLHNSKERELARLFNATRGPVHREIMRQAHETAREFTADHPIARGALDGIMSYDEFRKRYPDIWKQYKSDEETYRSTLTAYAFTQHVGNGHSVIALNPARMNPQTLYRTYRNDQQGENPYHPRGTTARDIVTHEMGHVAHRVWDSMEAHSNSPIAYMGLANAAYRLLNNNHARNSNEFARGYANAVSNVSGYATNSDRELVAEALADVRANGKNAKPMSRAINYVLNNRETALQRVLQLNKTSAKKYAKRSAKKYAKNTTRKRT